MEDDRPPVETTEYAALAAAWEHHLLYQGCRLVPIPLPEEDHDDEYLSPTRY